MQDYPGDELLVVYDPVFKYGQNFYLVLTEEAKERILNVSLRAGLKKPRIPACPLDKYM